LIPSKTDLINKAFGPSMESPDGLVPGGMNYGDLSCPAKGCRGCKGPNCRSGSESESECNSANNDAFNTSNPPAQTTLSTMPESSNDPASTTDTSETQNQPIMTVGKPQLAITRNPSQKSDTAKISSTSSVTATSTVYCKALAILDTGEDIPQSELVRRSYPVDTRSPSLKRHGNKSGIACKIELAGFNYPSSGAWRANELPKR
jgi:hypothetical protein